MADRTVNLGGGDRTLEDMGNGTFAEEGANITNLKGAPDGQP